ncbi:MAG TPA: hypothetical protein PK079_14835 [Leptospiraceae bacterium]|nr:hypothetical protein [Leptospiraceae bacterium]HMX34815.1 hypothetical protein [Leptospiraceae bacterium]HMY33477.1 hypothetical protein [Leptospiraceae bacterium]HMZ65998.1 hypothetical protein [Leptospiraceae bacterium]HNA05826.1 hypothetical protein [Leptospiraceae bacterium]
MKKYLIGFLICLCLLFLSNCTSSGKTCDKKCREKGNLCLLGINSSNQASVQNMIVCELYYLDCSSGCGSSSSKSSSSRSRSSSSGGGGSSRSSGGSSSSGGGGGGSSGGSSGSSHDIFVDFH